jgi:hypothetical protein
VTVEDTRPRLRYLATNENLLAIRHGLCAGPQDRVLCIAAAGDQAFALLEHVQKVVVVDMNPRQLDYVEKEIELIRNGDFLSFQKPQVVLKADPRFGFEVELLEGLNEYGLEQRRKYFTHSRLSAIQKKLDRIHVSKDTVLNSLEGKTFNKAYLTNIIGYQDSDFEEGGLLFSGANKIEVGGLVYISNTAVRPMFIQFMAQLGLEKEDHLTEVARALEPNWKPMVFRRTW